MRQFFLLLSRHRGLRKWIETSSVAKNLTKRFIAGETLEEVLAVCGQLQAEGISTALDHLGENVTSLEEAAGALDAYLVALDQIAARRLPATVSIKITQFGVDFSEQACLDNVRRLAAKATHDEQIIDEALRYTQGRGIGPDRFEFQMLYGIRRDLQRRLIGLGHRVRLYVPYGTAWYPYFMRRLAERPANVLFVARSLFR